MRVRYLSVEEFHEWWREREADKLTNEEVLPQKWNYLSSNCDRFQQCGSITKFQIVATLRKMDCGLIHSSSVSGMSNTNCRPVVYVLMYRPHELVLARFESLLPPLNILAYTRTDAHGLTHLAASVGVPRHSPGDVAHSILLHLSSHEVSKQ